MQMGTPEWSGNKLVQNQLSVADVVVITKMDVASKEEVAHAHNLIAATYPPKLAVYEVTQGEMPVAALDISRDITSIACTKTQPRVPCADSTAVHQRSQHHGGSGPGPQHQQGKSVLDSLPQRQRLPEARHPARFQSAAGEWPSCGWLFHPSDSFDVARLQEVLAVLLRHCARVKGIFRVASHFVSIVSAKKGLFTLQPVAHGRESRVEIISGVGEVVSDETICYGAAVAVPAHMPGGHDARNPDACSTPKLLQALRDEDWQVVEDVLVACLL
jgi:G3E family GTPase